MKRYRPLVFFGLALVLGLVTSVLVFSWMQNEKNRLMAAPIPISKNRAGAGGQCGSAMGDQADAGNDADAGVPCRSHPRRTFYQPGGHQGSGSPGRYQA